MITKKKTRMEREIRAQSSSTSLQIDDSPPSKARQGAGLGKAAVLQMLDRARDDWVAEDEERMQDIVDEVLDECNDRFDAFEEQFEALEAILDELKAK